MRSVREAVTAVFQDWGFPLLDIGEHLTLLRPQGLALVLVIRDWTETPGKSAYLIGVHWPFIFILYYCTYSVPRRRWCWWSTQGVGLGFVTAEHLISALVAGPGPLPSSYSMVPPAPFS